jgi:hypothetical protein
MIRTLTRNYRGACAAFILLATAADLAFAQYGQPQCMLLKTGCPDITCSDQCYPTCMDGSGAGPYCQQTNVSYIPCGPGDVNNCPNTAGTYCQQLTYAENQGNPMQPICYSSVCLINFTALSCGSH